jgi:ketosteroid isomerase-like protein
MTRTILAASLVATLLSVPATTPSDQDPRSEVLAQERKAMDAWVEGNPDPALAASAADITYFHVMTEKRLDGLPAVKALFDSYRGRRLYDGYEMLDPKVQVGTDMAVLTYILLQKNGAVTTRWNATQVYQRTPGGWRVIHSHWSQTAPSLSPQP